MRTTSPSAYLVLRPQAWLLAFALFAFVQPAMAQSVTASAGSPTPDPVAVGIPASASLTATATAPGVTLGCDLKGPTWAWTLDSGAKGFGIDHPDPASSAASIYTSADTLPGVYTVAATATATWTSECGTYSASATTSPVTFRVVGIQKLQYLSGGEYVDVTDTLYVLVGRPVTFRALADPAGSVFPDGCPVWSGTSGASGTGETVTVTFGVLSETVGDVKSVVATCGTSTQTATVVVYDLDPTLTPADNFDGRDLDTYGVCEIVNLSCPIVPSGVTESNVGGLQWLIESGGGELSGGPGANATYQCPDIAASVTLKVTILSGLMQAQAKAAPAKQIVPPTKHHMEQMAGTGLWHVKGCVGVQAKLRHWAQSNKVVSFAEIKVKEGDSTPAVTTGFFKDVLKLQGKVHTPTGKWLSLAMDPDPKKGYRWLAYDITGFGVEKDASFDPPFTAGTMNYSINMWYLRADMAMGAGNAGAITYDSVTSPKSSDAMGRAECSKCDAGPFVRLANQGTNTGFTLPDPP